MTGTDSSSAYHRLLDALRAAGRTVNHSSDTTAVAQCPAHDDGRPSLSLRAIPGRVLLWCFAGCKAGEVIGALELTPAALFDDPHGCSYHYHDGRIKDRPPNKKFRQRGNTKGTALFHAELIGSAETVYVVEGEQDVLTMESVGAVAVSPPEGAGAKASRWDWKPLAGKHVVIVADRDKPGRTHAHDVAAQLTTITNQVRIAESAVGNDVTDHIMAGRSLDKLVFTRTMTGIVVTSTLASDLKTGVPDWAWRFDHKGRLMRGTFVLFAGRGSAGKSTASRYFAAGFSTGDIAGCFAGEPCNVGYVASEESLKHVVGPSLLAHGADMSRIHFPKVHIDGNEVRLQSKRDEAALLEFLLDNDIRVLFIDPVMSAIGGGADINRNNETRDYIAPWQRIAEKTHGLVVGIAHLRKNLGTDVLAAINGSSAFGEVARAVIAFAREDATGDRVFSQEKNNAGDEDLAVSYHIESTTVQTDEGPAEVGRFVMGELSERRAGDLLRADGAREHLGERSYGILEAVRQSGEPCDPLMVATLVPGLSNDVAGKYMRRLAKTGLLVRRERGLFDVPHR
jgi:archaellum biogenesis ATPase FlaH/5S rRNA maturation endonuclease (ribonuclease M5)